MYLCNGQANFFRRLVVAVANLVKRPIKLGDQLNCWIVAMSKIKRLADADGKSQPTASYFAFLLLCHIKCVHQYNRVGLTCVFS